MGGRGSSSATSRSKAANARAAGGSVAGMSDERLASELKAVEADMERVGDVMARSAPGHMGYLQSTPRGSKADHETYTEAFKEYGTLRAYRDKVIDEQAKRASERTKAEPAKPEKPEREITSSTYKRAMAGQHRDVLNFMGRDRVRLAAERSPYLRGLLR